MYCTWWKRFRVEYVLIQHVFDSVRRTPDIFECTSWTQINSISFIKKLVRLTRMLTSSKRSALVHSSIRNPIRVRYSISQPEILVSFYVRALTSVEVQIYLNKQVSIACTKKPKNIRQVFVAETGSHCTWCKSLNINAGSHWFLKQWKPTLTCDLWSSLKTGFHCTQ